MFEDGDEEFARRDELCTAGVHFRDLQGVRQLDVREFSTPLIRVSNNRQHLLPDPTAFETPLIDTTITIALDSEDGSSSSAKGKAPKIRLVRQNGLGGLGGKQGMTGMALLGQCIGVAKERVKAMSEVLYSV